MLVDHEWELPYLAYDRETQILGIAGDTMKLLVGIVNYRITELAIDCLKSVAAEIESVPGMRVAVCENGTGSDAERRLRQAIDENGWGSWVELTAVYPNLGYTGGSNVIIRKAMEAPDPPEYFLLLNADTLVQPGAFKTLVDFMDAHPAAGVAASRLEWPDGSPQGSPFRFQGIASELDRGLRLGVVSKLLSRWCGPIPAPDTPCRVDWAAGASMIIRRRVVEDIGPLDEGLYTYFDDMDYCLNALRAGWETWFVPQSRVFHLEGASTGIAEGASAGMVARTAKRRPEYWFQARRRYFLKNHGPFYAALVDAAFLFGFSLFRLRRRLQRKPDTDPAHMLADSFRNSVFRTGFELRAVENPALRSKSSPG